MTADENLRWPFPSLRTTTRRAGSEGVGDIGGRRVPELRDVLVASKGRIAIAAQPGVQPSQI